MIEKRRLLIGMKYSIQKDQILFGVLFFIIYLGWNYSLVGLKSDHVIFAFFILLGSLAHRKVFCLFLGLSAFIIFLIIYDGLQIFPNYYVNPVSIQEIFDFEMKYFGFVHNGEKILLNHYFANNQLPIWTFFLGLSYLVWMPAPLIFSTYLYSFDKELLMRYSFCFLFVNLIGFIGYYLYPAAPPWYYFKYGNELHTNINGDAALLVNFDKLVGIPIFDSIYNRGANVFAAVPSLHCSFAVINLYYGIKSKSRIFIVAFVLLAFGTWIGAVYSVHHYVVDVILGIFTAILALFLYERLEFKKIFRPLSNVILKKIL